MADAKQTEAEAVTQEAEAQASYQTFVSESVKGIEALNGQIADLQAERAETDEDLSEKKEELGDHGKMLEDLQVGDHGKIRPGSGGDQIGTSIPEREIPASSRRERRAERTCSRRKFRTVGVAFRSCLLRFFLDVSRSLTSRLFFQC